MNMPNVSNVPLFLDCIWLGGFPGQNTIIGGSDNPDTPPGGFTTEGMMSRYCINRHNGNVNGLFLDLSVRKIGLKQLWNLKWHQKYNTQNRQTKKAASWPAWMKDFTNYFTD